MNTEFRKRADAQAMAYRENLSYIKGVESGMDEGGTLGEKYHERMRWIWAVERVREWLHLHEPLMEAFFVRYYVLDSSIPQCSHKKGESIVKVSESLRVGVSTLYKWREHILDQLVLAATQAGALEPF